MNNTEKYAGSVMIVDDQGNVVFERNMSGDEMVEELLKKLSGLFIVMGPTTAVPIFEKVLKESVLTGEKVQKNGKVKTFKKKVNLTKPAAGGGSTQAIIDLVNEGLKAGEIAKRLKVSIAMVYTTKSQAKKAGQLKAQPKRAVTETESKEVSEDAEVGGGIQAKQILDMLHDGIDEAEIAEQLGVRKAVVNMVKYSAKKRGEIFNR